MAGYVGKALPLDNYPVTMLLYEMVCSEINNMDYWNEPVKHSLESNWISHTHFRQGRLTVRLIWQALQICTINITVSMHNASKLSMSAYSRAWETTQSKEYKGASQTLLKTDTTP